MRRLSVVGVHLLFLWSLSPLGGQASLRILEKTTKSNPETATLRYLSTGPGAAARALDTAFAESLNNIHPLFSAAFLAMNNRKQSEDLWGNVKVPLLDRVAAEITAGPDGWYPVKSRTQLTTEDYVSLAGIPVIGRNLTQDARFNLETTQLSLQCHPFEQKVVSTTNYTGLEEIVPLGPSGINATGTNHPFSRTTYFMLLSEENENHTTRLDAFFGRQNDPGQHQRFTRRNITYAGLAERRFYNNRGIVQHRINAANCSLGQTHTETEVQCTQNAGCQATRMRRSATDSRPGEVTALDHPTIQDMLRYLPVAFGVSTKEGATYDEERSRGVPTEQFLFDSSSFPFVLPSSEDDENRGWVDISTIPPEVFSLRLGILLNTYYQIALAPFAYMGSLPMNNMSIYGPSTIPATDVNAYLPSNLTAANTTFLQWWPEFSKNTFNSGLAFVGAATNGTLSMPQEVYQCNFAWTAALFAASAILFAIGTASLVLKGQTLGPETFGFVSSMTYENPYLDIPRGGTMLDAMERSRLLRDVQVQVGDVKGDREVGHIAFTAGMPVRKLERGRLYT